MTTSEETVHNDVDVDRSSSAEDSDDDELLVSTLIREKNKEKGKEKLNFDEIAAEMRLIDDEEVDTSTFDSEVDESTLLENVYPEFSGIQTKAPPFENENEKFGAPYELFGVHTYSSGVAPKKERMSQLSKYSFGINEVQTYFNGLKLLLTLNSKTLISILKDDLLSNTFNVTVDEFHSHFSELLRECNFTIDNIPATVSLTKLRSTFENKESLKTRMKSTQHFSLLFSDVLQCLSESMVFICNTERCDDDIITEAIVIISILLLERHNKLNIEWRKPLAILLNNILTLANNEVVEPIVQQILIVVDDCVENATHLLELIENTSDVHIALKKELISKTLEKFDLISKDLAGNELTFSVLIEIVNNNKSMKPYTFFKFLVLIKHAIEIECNEKDQCDKIIEIFKGLSSKTRGTTESRLLNREVNALMSKYEIKAKWKKSTQRSQLFMNDENEDED